MEIFNQAVSWQWPRSKLFCLKNAPLWSRKDNKNDFMFLRRAIFWGIFSYWTNIKPGSILEIQGINEILINTSFCFSYLQIVYFFSSYIYFLLKLDHMLLLTKVRSYLNQFVIHTYIPIPRYLLSRILSTLNTHVNKHTFPLRKLACVCLSSTQLARVCVWNIFTLSSWNRQSRTGLRPA